VPPEKICTHIMTTQNRTGGQPITVTTGGLFIRMAWHSAGSTVPVTDVVAAATATSVLRRSTAGPTMAI